MTTKNSQLGNGLARRRPVEMRSRWVHFARVLIFVAILFVMRLGATQPGRSVEQETSFETVESLRLVLPTAESIDAQGKILDVDGRQLGFALWTLPGCADVVGYSGPTNCLIILGSDGGILGVQIVHSEDTVEHMDLVREHADFLESFRRIGAEPPFGWRDIDVVSGATLSSYSIIESVARRIQQHRGSAEAGESLAPSLKFATEPNLDRLRGVVEKARGLSPDESGRGGYEILDEKQNVIGWVALTSPAADGQTGYQGPTATGMVFDPEGHLIGLYVDQSYDNSPYAQYLNDDYPFQLLYRGKTLAEIADMDPDRLGVEGVSGATMTSMAVARGLPLAAASLLPRDQAKSSGASGASEGQLGELSNPKIRNWTSYWPDAVTLSLVAAGVAWPWIRWGPAGKSSRSARRIRGMVRVGFQLTVILMLGFMCGHMLSQALIAGWATSSIPWRTAPGLVALAAAAFLVPVFSKRQPYCQHLCPLGNVQQLIKRRLPWQLTLNRHWKRWLQCLPVMLLLLVVSSMALGWKTNLAAIEAFDAFAFRVAGWSTLLILFVGTIASLFVPMAYCQYGCPTGSVLNFLKYRGDSGRLGLRDAVAIGLLAVGVSLLLLI